MKGLELHPWFALASFPDLIRISFSRAMTLVHHFSDEVGIMQRILLQSRRTGCNIQQKTGGLHLVEAAICSLAKNSLIVIKQSKNVSK